MSTSRRFAAFQPTDRNGSDRQAFSSIMGGASRSGGGLTRRFECAAHQNASTTVNASLFTNWSSLSSRHTHFYWVVNEFGDEAAPSRTLRRALQRESRQGLRGVLIPRHREPLRKAASLVRQLNRFACWSIAPSTGRIVKKKTQSQSGECRSCAMDDTQIFAGRLALALLRRIKLSSRNQSRVRATLPPRVICSPAGQSQAQAHPGRRWSPHIIANKVSSRQPGGRGSLCGAMGNGWLGSGPSWCQENLSLETDVSLQRSPATVDKSFPQRGFRRQPG